MSTITIRRAVPATIALLCALLLAVPAQASAVEIGPDVPDPSSARIVIPAGSPTVRNLNSRWEPDEASPLPSTTRTLTATVPQALFDFGTPLTALIAGAKRNPVALTSVDAATRTVTVDIPEGYFTSPAGAPATFEGTLRYSLVLETSIPGASRGNTAYVSIGFLAGGPGASEHARTVTPAGAFGYYSSISYSLDPDTEVDVRSLDRIVVDGVVPFQGATAVSTGRWDTDRRGASVPTRVVSSGGAAVEVEVASEFTMRGITTSRALLTLQGSSDGTSVTVTLPYTLVHSPTSGPGTTIRLAGADRFEAAVGYSREGKPDVGSGTPVLSVASGSNFPDALTAAAATAHVGGSLLLVTQGDMWRESDRSTCDEAQRLNPAAVRVAGGPASVGDQASVSVRTCAQVDGVERLDGADRYEVSRRVASTYFDDGASTVFIATGTTFPDALSAVPAAATQDAPVVLVPGGSPSLDQATLDTLRTLGARRFVIVGGPASVSQGIQSQLSTLGAVERISGADRYEVSAAVNTRFFPTASEAFLATGANFPDALTGGVLAASRNAPLLLVRTECLPPSAHAALTRWNVARTTLLGGTSSLNATVMDLRACV
ncbi:cell wall-binding repeat-containing protein [Herbiconiux sp. P15]|uniref:cell wall-binding repeat-containing protein n=1 Tax=Herbiconiux liukaitaii TaxID=3342799 RepID=UPI0035BA2AFC